MLNKKNITIGLLLITFMLFGLGTYIFVITNNPEKFVASNWTRKISTNIFIKITQKVDPEYSRLLNDFVLNYKTNINRLNELNKSELKILRNTFFAVRGYVFTDRELLDFYKRFPWYHTNEESKGDMQELNDYEKELLKIILDLENSVSGIQSREDESIITNNLIPSNFQAALIWDFKLFDPYIYGPIFYENKNLLYSFDTLKKHLTDWGFDYNSLMRVSVFSLESTVKYSSFGFEIFLEIDEPDKKILHKLFKDYYKVKIYKDWEVWLHDNGEAIAFSPRGVIISSSYNNAYLIIDESNKKSSFSSDFKSFSKNSSNIGMFISINDTNSWPITLGPANLYAKDILCIIMMEDDEVIALAKGHPYIDLRKEKKFFNVRKESFYLDIPRPGLWPEIILNGSKSHNMTYSFKDNEILLELMWKN